MLTNNNGQELQKKQTAESELRDFTSLKIDNIINKPGVLHPFKKNKRGTQKNDKGVSRFSKSMKQISKRTK